MREFFYESMNGCAYKCKKCARIHIEYGTTVIELEIKQFWEFNKYVESVNPDWLGSERFILPLLGREVYCGFTRRQFEEFRLLLSEAMEHLTNDNFMSQDRIDQVSGLSDHYWTTELDKSLPN